MLQQLAEQARPVLESPYILRVRRNHGLEHATIHLLNRQRYRLSGRSSEVGFVIMGDVPTDKVEKAAHEALLRMRNGEHGLAIHPNCGTNLVTTGLLTTLIGGIGFMGAKPRAVWNRFPLVMSLMMVGVLFSQPLGMALQKHFTTEGDPGDLEIVGVNRRLIHLPFNDSEVTLHEVMTHSALSKRLL